MKTNRAASYRARDKTSQEGTGVEPTGEAKERETPAHLARYENGRVGEETSHVE